MITTTIGCQNENKKVDLHQYMQLLRERRIIPSKFSPYLDLVTLYVNDGRVYKVMLIAYKTAKKVGLHHMHIMIKDNLPKNMLISPSEANIDKGLLLIQYVYKQDNSIYFPEKAKCFYN